MKPHWKQIVTALSGLALALILMVPAAMAVAPAAFSTERPVDHVIDDADVFNARKSAHGSRREVEGGNGCSVRQVALLHCPVGHVACEAEFRPFIQLLLQWVWELHGVPHAEGLSVGVQGGAHVDRFVVLIHVGCVPIVRALGAVAKERVGRHGAG